MPVRKGPSATCCEKMLDFFLSFLCALGSDSEQPFSNSDRMLRKGEDGNFFIRTNWGGNCESWQLLRTPGWHRVNFHNKVSVQQELNAARWRDVRHFHHFYFEIILSGLCASTSYMVSRGVARDDWAPRQGPPFCIREQNSHKRAALTNNRNYLHG